MVANGSEIEMLHFEGLNVVLLVKVVVRQPLRIVFPRLHLQRVQPFCFTTQLTICIFDVVDRICSNLYLTVTIQLFGDSENGPVPSLKLSVSKVWAMQHWPLTLTLSTSSMLVIFSSRSSLWYSPSLNVSLPNIAWQAGPHCLTWWHGSLVLGFFSPSSQSSESPLVVFF